MAAITIEPLVGDWIYPAAIAALLAIPALGASARHAGRRVHHRLAARWDAWCLTPQPPDTVARHARKPPTRGAR